MKLNTMIEINEVLSHTETLKEAGVNLGEDAFMLIQPYPNNQAIILKVDDEQNISMYVSDTVVILPEREGYLDVFKNPQSLINDLVKRDDVKEIEIEVE